MRLCGCWDVPQGGEGGSLHGVWMEQSRDIPESALHNVLGTLVAPACGQVKSGEQIQWLIPLEATEWMKDSQVCCGHIDL